jgi:4-coumarate--CoA ligase
MYVSSALMKNIHLPMFNGISVVVHQGFQLEDFLESIQHHRITLIHVVPPIILKLGKDRLVDQYDLSSLRMIISGAAPLTEELEMAVHKRIKVPVKQAYGLTETSPLVLSAPWNKKPVPGSSGYLMPNLLLKFVDEQGQELERGETGELWLKGPNIMQGHAMSASSRDLS